MQTISLANGLTLTIPNFSYDSISKLIDLNVDTQFGFNESDKYRTIDLFQLFLVESDDLIYFSDIR